MKNLVPKIMIRFVIVILISTFFLEGCTFGNRDIVLENNRPVINSVGDIITEEYDIYYETVPDTINYSNPKENKYIGAYLENPVYKGSIKTFEDTMVENSMYVFDFNLNDLDKTLLKDTVVSCINHSAVPYIILTSNSAIYDMKIEDIKEVMDVLRKYNYPMIIELLPYQRAHNYNDEYYQLFYIQAYDLVKKANKRVDIAFPVEAREIESSEKYLPDSKYFDYISIRLDVDTKMTKEKMMYLLDEVYQSHLNKPKVLNIAISHFDPVANEYYSEEAFEKFEKVYTRMLDSYQNIVAVNYMDYSYNPDMSYPYNERYTLSGVTKISNEYKLFSNQNQFLKTASYVYDDKCVTEYKEKAIKVEDKVYMPNSLQDMIGTKLKTRKINGNDYFDLNEFKEIINSKNYYLILDEENGTIKLTDQFTLKRN